MSKPSVSNCIRRLRFNAEEMTQESLANRVRCTRQTIIALEAGKYVPSLTLAHRIASVFGVTIEHVFQFSDEGNTQ